MNEGITWYGQYAICQVTQHHLKVDCEKIKSNHKTEKQNLKINKSTKIKKISYKTYSINPKKAEKGE